MPSTRNVLFREDWSGFEPGHLRRDNSARGEYLCQVLPDNRHGWYQPSAAGWNAPSFGHGKAPWSVEVCGRGRIVAQKGRVTADLLCLTRGEEPWRDYTVSSVVWPEGEELTGLIGRYRTSRDFYAAGWEHGVLKLVRRIEGVWSVIAQTPIPRPAKARLALAFRGARIAVKLDGRVVLSAVDGSLPSGGIGLLALSPARFGSVQVVGQTPPAAPAAIATPEATYPPAELALEIDIAGHACGRQIRFADLDGDGREEILFALPEPFQGRTWRYLTLRRLTALDLNGRVMWSVGAAPTELLEISMDLPFQAADRGGGVDVVAAFGDRLRVLDPRSGEVRQEAFTPVPPDMEPYWDEIQQYFGDGHGDDLERLIPDAIRLCNLTGRGAYHDLVIKDRYHNAWGIDGTTLAPLWHRRCNLGHFPFAWDPDGRGRDTVILGYSRVDHAGQLVGRLVLGDHPDACFAYVAEDGLRHILHPAGEAGLIDERSDGHLDEVHLGHVQHLSVANFCRDLPGLERIVVTYHHGEGIIVLLDHRNRILRKTERFARGAICQPVNWTGDGRELIAFSPTTDGGGLWDERFDLVVPLPSGPRPARCMEVHDVLGLGVDQLVVWDERKLQVYRPAAWPSNGGRRYAPRRPGPNLSNYQVNFSLPAWKS